ncbi:MAG: adenine deaminase [Alphaproteobacteria bacterium]|nr:adenine deaminase [Alphaproteobacteria bacterium]
MSKADHDKPALPAERVRAIAAAQGQAPFDLLVCGGTLVDVATAELRPADIGIVGGLVASIHPRGARADAAERLDAAGAYLAPGLIDTHVHLESSHMLPVHYAATVLAQGTTTVFWDPHELANVLGLEGVRWAIAASRGLALRVLVGASSSVPSAPGLERAGAEIGGAEMARMLRWPEVAGVAEVMDMAGVLSGTGRMAEVLAAGLASGKPIAGHARGLAGPKLQGFVAAGIGSDHELVSAADAIEKLRAGLWVELRGSHDYLLPEIVLALKALPRLPATLSLCTDDVFPDQLVRAGGMIDLVRRLVRYGLDPVQALVCGTHNGALRLGRSDIGLIGPGRAADLVLLDDLGAMAVRVVVAGGRIVARDGALAAPLAAPPAPALAGSVRVPTLGPEDFRIRLPAGVVGAGRRRALLRGIRGARFTQWTEIEAEVQDGIVQVPEHCSLMAVVHRHGRDPALPRLALLEDWGLWRGAWAATYAHDAHNLVLFGRDPADMAAAANAVIAAGGGMAVAAGGAVRAILPLPVAGLLSDAAPVAVADGFAALRAAADDVAEWKPPYRVFKALFGAALACNAGPHLTDMGLTDGGSGRIEQMLVRML